MSDIEKAATLLKQGELVAIPTETVYGLAANAFSNEAVAKIFETKNRPSTNPLIVHIHSIDQLPEIARNIPDMAYTLAEHFWPGPLTMVLEKAPHISDKVTAGKTTVAVRIPDHELTLELLRKLDFPLVAPSANRSNHISPTRPEHVKNSLGDKAPFILDGGHCTRGIESTIVGFERGTPTIYRLGTTAREELEKVLGRPVEMGNTPGKVVVAPGMFKKHYSPRTPFTVTTNVQEEVEKHPGKKLGILYFGDPDTPPAHALYRILSPEGDAREAASKLYGMMHELDELGLDLIIAQLLPEEGVGASVNDRMTRAASK
ncbi:L-threonylcarbamoyladenylate synthase [Robertkochia sediminum]|uniref:L-threonylcarbamoyladenylate synthase n=1 Tax=Robertkochia sediminum TaxID=2785326 RepID=UPI001933D54D|nr:L-threonylcarbamoyladenylate synthase [Robertkochia sediminum]MBL7472018.1 threonylcarbamoyl-AMP synthase [Robertkochia sediminum]